MALSTNSPLAISPRSPFDMLHGIDETDMALPQTSNQDSDLTSFIDALWDEQMSGTAGDFALPEHQPVRRSLGSFGGMHILDTSPSAVLLSPGTEDIDVDSFEPEHSYQQPQTTISTQSGHDMSISPSMHANHFAAPSTCTYGESWQPQSYPVFDDGQCRRETSQQSPSMQAPHNHYAGWDRSSASHTPSQIGTSDELDASEVSEPCYARLLHRCLRETPNHTLTLKEIYAWIKQHTQKAGDPRNKGWQNSVRHNLSMNAAFERVAMSTHSGESKKGSLWRLTPQAIRNGVISTTRYRRDPKRKSDRRGAPAPKRQISGAKGGAATRAASQARRQFEAKERLARAAHGRAQQRFFTSVPGHSIVAPAVAPHHPNFHQIPSCQSVSATPYFVNSIDTSPAIMQSSYSDPNTPLQVHLSYEDQQKPFLGEFQLQQIDFSRGLFGNVDDRQVYTPSLQTESSFLTDEPMSAPTSNSMML